MNREQLKQVLATLKLNTNDYSLSGGLANEQYVLDQESSGKWAVYYSERGQKTGLRQFNLEEEACSFFLEQITSI